MNGHTPGPWEFFIDDSGGEWSGWPISVDATDDPDKTVVRTGGFWPYKWGTPTSQREAVANARLISAAPDLLEALQGVLDDLDSINRLQGFYDLSKARAAIAKATGKN